MRDTLKVGDVFTWSYTVPVEKTVPYLYPESQEFRKMPEVFATGFMVGLIEWCCIEALLPHLDDGEGSLGTSIAVSHNAPTPPGMTVTVAATCDEINGNNVFWNVTARDELGIISEGRHGRHVVAWERFSANVTKKAAKFAAMQNKNPQ